MTWIHSTSADGVGNFDSVSSVGCVDGVGSVILTGRILSQWSNERGEAGEVKSNGIISAGPPVIIHLHLSPV